MQRRIVSAATSCLSRRFKIILCLLLLCVPFLFYSGVLELRYDGVHWSSDPLTIPRREMLCHYSFENEFLIEKLIHIPVQSKYYLNIGRYSFPEFGRGFVEAIRRKYLYIRHVDVDYNVRRWRSLNEDHKVILYDEWDRRTLIAQELPQYLDLYDALYTTVERVDFWRYAVLYVHGGFYADSDVMPCLPVSSIGNCVPVKSSRPIEGVLFMEVGQSNFTTWQFHIGVLWGRKHHKIWLDVMEQVRRNVRSEMEAGKLLFASVLDRTGSGALTPIANAYLVLKDYLIRNDTLVGDFFIEMHDRVVHGPLLRHFMARSWEEEYSQEALDGFQRALEFYRQKRLRI